MRDDDEKQQKGNAVKSKEKEEAMTNDLLKLAFNVQGPGRFLSAFSLAAAAAEKNVRRMANSRPWICWYVRVPPPSY